MVTLEQIEARYNYTFPAFFTKLWEEGMLNYMRGFEEGLKEGENWTQTVYPTLKERPPILLHSGEVQLSLLTPDAMLNFVYPPFWDTQTHHFIPFAKTLEGNVFAFYANIEIDGENPIVEIWDEMDDAEYYAKNFEEFIVRQMLESANDIDKDDLKAEYKGDIKAYIADVHLDIQSIAPYLRPQYTQLLSEIYNREPIEGMLSYALLDKEELDSLIEKYLDFDLRDESFQHEF